MITAFQSPWLFRNVTDNPNTPVREWGTTTWLNLLQYGYVQDLRIVAAELRSAALEPWVDNVLMLVKAHFELSWSPLIELVIAAARGDEEPFCHPIAPPNVPRVPPPFRRGEELTL